MYLTLFPIWNSFEYGYQPAWYASNFSYLVSINLGSLLASDKLINQSMKSLRSDMNRINRSIESQSNPHRREAFFLSFYLPLEICLVMINLLSYKFAWGVSSQLVPFRCKNTFMINKFPSSSRSSKFGIPFKQFRVLKRWNEYPKQTGLSLLTQQLISIVSISWN